MEELRNFTMKQLSAKLALDPPEFDNWLKELGLLHRTRICPGCDSLPIVDSIPSISLMGNLIEGTLSPPPPSPFLFQTPICRSTKTTLGDDEIEKYFEGIMDVVSGKIQAKTAAQRHRLDLKQLNKFIGLVKLDDEEDEEEESETNVGGNDENAMEEDRNLEKEDDEEEETKDEGKHKQKAVKKGATIKEKKSKQKKAKMESEKKGKSSNEVKDIDPPKPAKKKRGKHELEVLLAEANENVFKGQHPNNQSLELALAKNHHDEEENHHSTMPPIGTRSRRSLTYSTNTNAILQQKPLPMGWKEKAANNVQSESTISSSSHSGPSNSTNDQSSWAVVPFNKPRASKGSIALAKPNKTQKRSTDNSPKFIAERERWAEYRAMVEEIVDDVLLGMQDRNFAEKQRKVGMRVAILEILFVQTPVQQASKDEHIGVSTTRRYLKEVKLRLDKYFGDEAVDDEFLKQFKNYKGTVTQEHYREAMRRSKKIPPEFEGKKESRKRSAANMMMGTPSNDSSTSANPTAAKRPRTSQSNTSANAKMDDRKPMAKMNNVKPEMNTSPGTGGTSSGSAVVKANGPNPIGTVTTMATLNEGQQQPLHLMTSQLREREPIEGTPEEIRKMIYDFFAHRYQGDVNILAKLLSNFLVADAQCKKYSDDCPLPILCNAYMMFGRHFQVENVKVKDGDE